MSARKVGLLLLIVLFGATVETAWRVRGAAGFGPEGCRVVSGRFHGPSWSFEARDERSVETAPRLAVENAFGAVRVRPGGSGKVVVRLRKVVFQPTEEKARAFAERIVLELEGDGRPLRIRTNRDDLERSGERVGFETHLEIEAPADAVLTIENEHGPTDLAGMAGGEVKASFDAVTVEDIRGDLKVDGRHGEVAIDGVGGALTLKARHGRAEVRRVAGRSAIDAEHGDLIVQGSGGLEVKHRHGNVEVASVEGDLQVRSEHGEVSISDVAGAVEVEASFGPLRLARVGGAAKVRCQHGRVQAEDVRGGLEATSSHEGIEAQRIGGELVANVDNGGVVAGDLGAGVRVRASGGAVELDGVSGAVDVELERGDVSLAPRSPVSHPVRIRVAHGEVRLDLPRGSRLDLDLVSRRGEIQRDVEGLEVRSEESDRGPGASLRASLAGGGTSIEVQADGDVSLTSSTPTATRQSPNAPRLETPASALEATPDPGRTRPVAPPEAPLPPRS